MHEKAGSEGLSKQFKVCNSLCVVEKVFVDLVIAALDLSIQIIEFLIAHLLERFQHPLTILRLSLNFFLQLEDRFLLPLLYFGERTYLRWLCILATIEFVEEFHIR